jgi:uncharacterized protein
VNSAQKPQAEWWAKGVRFECQGSGQCCVSHGEFGYVFMNLKDRQRMAKELKLTTAVFTKKYCDKLNGVFHLKEDPKKPACMFLKDKRCSVYQGRPTQCRTWPFWPEVMSAKVWKKEVAQFCPGVGKGPLISAETIQAQLSEQKKAESDLV